MTDCHICHHDPRLSNICSKCGPNCLDCQLANKMGSTLDAISDAAKKEHDDYWRVAKKTNPPQLEDEELPYDDLCDCPSCTGRGGSMGWGGGFFND